MSGDEFVKSVDREAFVGLNGVAPDATLHLLCLPYLRHCRTSIVLFHLEVDISESGPLVPGLNYDLEGRRVEVLSLLDI